MSDLTITEQKHVRTALRYLRNRVGAWEPVADALGFKCDTIDKVVNQRGRSVSPTMAFRVARLAGVTIDDLLEGRFLPGACPRCGHVPDFADESTIVEEPEQAAIERRREIARQGERTSPRTADYTGPRIVR